ncbi:acyl-CoA thioesterase [Streptomyces beigongshangae]|uniref:acyl-CoA thioesterase n=1 Tax=Streptomyces beigongshangae TaxID=2841597 RepID=UPI001C8505F4|nr:thioesterase family protein [Streptomyces sp. REN17]
MNEPVHVEHLRVLWADTDAGGRIHWSAVFRWAEAAEHAFLRTLGWRPAEAGSYPRRSTEAAYHRPLRFGQDFELRISVERVRTGSVTFGWTATSDGQVCVSGSHTVVHIDADGRPAPWPDRLRAGLADGGRAAGDRPGRTRPAGRPVSPS